MQARQELSQRSSGLGLGGPSSALRRPRSDRLLRSTLPAGPFPFEPPPQTLGRASSPAPRAALRQNTPPPRPPARLRIADATKEVKAGGLQELASRGGRIRAEAGSHALPLESKWGGAWAGKEMQSCGASLGSCLGLQTRASPERRTDLRGVGKGRTALCTCSVSMHSGLRKPE